MAVTIKDVAKAAGTSTATVSKVLNGSYSISEATRNRVNKIVEELGYHPNVRARNFARKQTNSIVFITDLKQHTAFNNPHMFEIMSGVESQLSLKNYSLKVRGANSEEACILAEQIIAQKSADGIVFHASVVTEKLSEILINSQFPHIVIGLPDFISQLCWIDTNNYLSGEIATRHLIEEGYTKFAYIGGYEEDLISEHRLVGIKTALKIAKIELIDSFIKQCDSSIEQGKEKTREILKNNDLPDVIICANNNIAYSCVKEIREKGFTIPKDIGVITFDDYPYAQITQPKLTVVDVDMYDMGIQAGKLVINKIRRPNLQVQTYITLPHLIVRESTKKQV